MQGDGTTETVILMLTAPTAVGASGETTSPAAPDQRFVAHSTEQWSRAEDVHLAVTAAAMEMPRPTTPPTRSPWSTASTPTEARCGSAFMLRAAADARNSGGLLRTGSGAGPCPHSHVLRWAQGTKAKME